jgi:cell division septal protein FtsQ
MEKPVRLSEKRRRKKFFFAIGILVLILASVGGIAYATHLGSLRISDIRVNGAQSMESEEIVAVADEVLAEDEQRIFSRRNVFLFSKDRVRDAIMNAFPRVASVRMNAVSIQHPILVITVSEREAAAAWCREEDECYVMDAEGYIFAKGDFDSGQKFAGGFTSEEDPIGHRFLPTHMESVRSLIAALQEIGFETEQFTVTNEQDFTITVSGGMDIRASFDQSQAVVLSNLQSALASDVLRGRESEIEYIDLRFGNRVYYRFEGAIENSAALGDAVEVED